MTSKERLLTALRGGNPDRVPVLPIYDNGYLFTSVGRDAREFRTVPAAERLAVIEQNFLRHDVDGLFVYEGTSDEWSQTHEIEKRSREKPRQWHGMRII